MLAILGGFAVTERPVSVAKHYSCDAKGRICIADAGLCRLAGTDVRQNPEGNFKDIRHG